VGGGNGKLFPEDRVGVGKSNTVLDEVASAQIVFVARDDVLKFEEERKKRFLAVRREVGGGV
jgi:hypothetical protein